MTRLRLSAFVGVVLCVAAAACGKKGDPLPPLRPVPARITDFEAIRSAGQVELRFTVPSVNLDDTTPVAIDRVDIYALRAPADEPRLPAGQIAGDRDRLLTSLPVRRPETRGDGAGSGVSALVPAPGERASYVDRTATDDPSIVVSYVAVPVAGTGRGRPGPPSAPAHVPLDPPPAAPEDLEATWTNTELRLSWTADASENMRYRVLERGADGSWRAVTPEPVTGGTFDRPVRFGEETCLAVQAVLTDGNVTSEGAPSSPVCVTPVDTYPPPAPASLQLVQEGTAVTLIWSAVEAADLAGYQVLRGEGPDGAMAPLTGGLLSATTYRDTTVEPGVTYRYAVRAVDSAPAANASGLSPIEAITVR